MQTSGLQVRPQAEQTSSQDQRSFDLRSGCIGDFLDSLEAGLCPIPDPFCISELQSPGLSKRSSGGFVESIHPYISLFFFFF